MAPGSTNARPLREWPGISLYRLPIFVKIKSRPQCAVLIIGSFKAGFFTVGQIPLVFQDPVLVIHFIESCFFLVRLFPGIGVIDLKADAAVIVVFFFP